jgi:transcriptional regulator with XRE-family HTH domain
MCPRLYDLDTVAYWILEKDAHSQKFKANLRHITQVVFDLYKRREHLYIKALKLSGRQDREAFKPHPYEIKGDLVSITSPKKEPSTEIGTKIREIRTRMGMSQKELADKVDLTSSFVSQLENSQISPSLNSFLQICNVLGVSPGVFWGDRKPAVTPWLFRRETIISAPASAGEGVRLYHILSDENLSARMAVLPPDTSLKRHFLSQKDPEFIYVLHGDLYVSVEGRTERLQSGDCIYLKESSPSQWKNEGGDEARLLVVW